MQLAPSGVRSLCPGWVTGYRDDASRATDGLPSAADAPLQRSELAKSANHVGSRSCDPELKVRQLIDRIADSRRTVGTVEVDPLPKSPRPRSRRATAIVLFGFDSGAALATVVGVLVEVPVMLSVVRITMRTKNWYERAAVTRMQGASLR